MEHKKLMDRLLGKDFDAPQYDPKKGRDKLVKAIDTAAKQHTDGSTKAPNRSWKVGGNNAVRFVPKLNGNEILLDDGHPAYVPAEHFQTFLGQLKTSVQNGHLDKEIKAALDGKAPSTTSSTTSRKRSPASGDKPYTSRQGYADLSRADKQKISALYRYGKNPDGSLIADAGHNPDAPLA
ncbi:MULTISPECIES: hypothetical protein [unclassified Sphingomonas]|uniref:hypothetical protein n=1 Tax=Sphingomonas sp. PvP015 TaxID=3156388 RepID=UPI0033963229